MVVNQNIVHNDVTLEISIITERYEYMLESYGLLTPGWESISSTSEGVEVFCGLVLENEVVDSSSKNEFPSHGGWAGYSRDWARRFLGHIQLGEDPRADPEHAGGITCPIWPWESSRMSWWGGWGGGCMGYLA